MATRLFPVARQQERPISPSAAAQLPIQTEGCTGQPTVNLPETATLSPRKAALPALTGLRTLLAVNVMFFHFTPALPPAIRPVVDNAFTFVGCFFLISGFILAYNYADRPSISRRKFYVARFARIYPVYLLVLVLSVPFLFQEWQAHSRSEFFTGLLLTPLALQGWSPSLATFWNTVGWTLPAEITLYLLFPYLLRLVKAHNHHFETPSRLIVGILLLWAIGISPHIVYWITNPDHLSEPVTRYTYGFWLRTLKYTPPFYICTFAAGVLLARLHALLDLTPFKRGVIALVALIALGSFFAFGAQGTPYVLIHGSLLMPLFAMLLIGLAGPNTIASAFAWKPIVLLGETTFALYLVHFNTFLLLHLYKIPERLHVARFDPWISYVAIILLAVVITFQYERPARNFVLKHLSPVKE